VVVYNVVYVFVTSYKWPTPKLQLNLHFNSIKYNTSLHVSLMLYRATL